MPNVRILVVEDEEDILEMIRYNLENEGYEVCVAATGEGALTAAESSRPNLILLDLMLPGLDGYEVCRLLKKNEDTARIPIIMLTAKGEESDIVAGLELGADDYITKPFSPRVLIARIRAVLRRKSESVPGENAVITIHNLRIDPGRFEVLVEGRPVDLTQSEFQILHFLSRHPGWVFTRAQIIDGVKGSDYPVTDRSVDVQIVGLRKKLGSAGKRIETVRGLGYRFGEADDE